MWEAISHFAKQANPVIGLALTGVSLYNAYNNSRTSEATQRMIQPTINDVRPQVIMSKRAHDEARTNAKHGRFYI
jgi:hypothetical protein